MRKSALVLSLVLFVACGGRRTASSANEPANIAGAPSMLGADASAAVRACMHDTKDLAPCNEDCDRGIATACSLVAERLERGDGVPRDLTRAVLLHERACELRTASACVSAARMHASGTGVPPNRTRQIDLLDAACKLGDGFSCSVPAKAYATGNGVPRDEHRAHDLWQRACASGIERACEEIGEAVP